MNAALTLAVLAAACTAPATNGGGVVEGAKPARVIVDKVLEFEDAAEPAAPTARFGDGTTCRLDRSHPHYARHARLLKEEQAVGRIVYVECDPDSGAVRDVAVTALRRIEKVAPAPEGDRLPVQILMAPSRHFVLTSHPRYDDMKRVLTELAGTGQPVLVTVGAGTTEIIDARRPPEGYSRPVI